MRTILLHLLLLAIPILGMSQSTPTSVNRGAANLTQVDQYLTAAKRLGIPTSPTDNLAATETPQNSAKLLYNTTLNKLRVYNPVTETWRDAIEADLTNYYTKTEIDALLNGKISTSEKGQNNGVAPLDASGKIPPQYVDIPDVPVTSVNGKTGDVVLTKTDVGLGNVDNTSDLAKPISTATQTALDGKVNLNGSNVIAGQTWGINISGLAGNSEKWGNMAVNWGDGAGQDFNFPVVIDSDGIAKPAGKNDFTGWLGYTLSTPSLSSVALSESNSVEIKGLTTNNFDWATTNFENIGFFNASQVGSPSEGTNYSGIYMPLGFNYSTQLAFRNNRGYIQSVENGVRQPWVEIATKEWVNENENNYWSASRLSAGEISIPTYDANNGSMAGGFVASYYTSDWLQNGAFGGYGGLITWTGSDTGLLKLQMQYDVGHGNPVGGRLAFRTSNSDSNPGSYTNWKELWHSGNLRSNAQNDARYLQLTGGTVTGVIKSPAPVADEDLANKAYVDSQSAIEALNEGSGIGYAIRGRNPNNYGSIGFGAVDLSTSTKSSFIAGATGTYAVAMGSGTQSSGSYSVAMGNLSKATGSFTVAMGSGAESSGTGAFSTGNATIASGAYSAVFGQSNQSTGGYSVSFGLNNRANNYASLVIGRNSTIGSAETGWVNGSPVFKVGNGINSSNRSNAYVLYNDGRSEQIKDVEVTEIGQGVVIKSPDGTRWRITVDNSGNLTTTSL